MGKVILNSNAPYWVFLVKKYGGKFGEYSDEAMFDYGTQLTANVLYTDMEKLVALYCTALSNSLYNKRLIVLLRRMATWLLNILEVYTSYDKAMQYLKSQPAFPFYLNILEELTSLQLPYEKTWMDTNHSDNKTKMCPIFGTNKNGKLHYYKYKDGTRSNMFDSGTFVDFLNTQYEFLKENSKMVKRVKHRINSFLARRRLRFRRIR